jgi:hypothetical protein
MEQMIILGLALGILVLYEGIRRIAERRARRRREELRHLLGAQPWWGRH